MLGAGASCFVVVGTVVSVSLATRGQADMRGLVTAGRVFGWSGSACLGSSVAHAGLLIADSRVAPRAAANAWSTKQIVGGYSSITARDQHQPASSRAMATLAIAWRFFRRAVKVSQRWCSRRLPAWPRPGLRRGLLPPVAHGLADR